MTSRTMKLIGLCLGALLVLLVASEPSRMPTVFLILPFLLIFICLLFLVQTVLKKTNKSGSKNFRFAALIASFPVILLAMQSVGQLTLRDSGMIIALFVITYLYLYRATRSTN